jgi:hypothetical protein|nr:MAG TPA: minor capsid component [Caudoviricetes sp.]
MEGFLRKIYDGFDVSNDIEPTAWREVLRVMNSGTISGLSDSKTPPTHEESFLRSIRHSNEVFSAFKTHAIGTKMAERLIGEDGKLRSFEEWRKAVAPIARHQVGSWLRTEYDTAVIRAHQAADWLEFEANKDIFPNLQWMPTTSVSPESSHQVFWSKPVILPVDDPFWQEHRPGDRWNCKCSLDATDADVQRLDTEERKEAAKPEHQAQRGLEGNPAYKGLITDKHPYYPESCAKCPFYSSKGIKGWVRKHLSNRVKDCHNCPHVDLKIFQAKLSEQYPLDRWEHTFISDSGGYVVTERLRIKEGKVNSTERDKFNKELETAKVMAKHGFAIVYLGESGRTQGKTYDILLNGISCEIKCFSGKQGGAIEEQLKYAFSSQGAKTVVVRLEERGGRAYDKLTTCLKTQKLLKDKPIYFFWMDTPEELEIFPSREIIKIK